MGRKVTVATCALNQWALDFEGNLQRILKSESGTVGGVGGGAKGLTGLLLMRTALTWRSSRSGRGDR